MSPVRALWLPYVVADLASAREFYTMRLGLSEVDSWRSGRERGSVLRVPGGAYLELVEPGPELLERGPPPLAFEVDAASTVEGYATRFEVARPPHRYPRGHYGFEAPGPAGATIMVWSERA